MGTRYMALLLAGYLLAGCGLFDMHMRVAGYTETGATIYLHDEWLDAECVWRLFGPQFEQADQIALDTVRASSFYGKEIDAEWFERRLESLTRLEVFIHANAPPGAGQYEGRSDATIGYGRFMVGTYAHEMVTALLWDKYSHLIWEREVVRGNQLLYDIETNISVVYDRSITPSECVLPGVLDRVRFLEQMDY